MGLSHEIPHAAEPLYPSQDTFPGATGRDEAISREIVREECETQGPKSTFVAGSLLNLKKEAHTSTVSLPISIPTAIGHPNGSHPIEIDDGAPGLTSPSFGKSSSLDNFMSRKSSTMSSILCTAVPSKPLDIPVGDNGSRQTEVHSSTDTVTSSQQTSFIQEFVKTKIAPLGSELPPATTIPSLGLGTIAENRRVQIADQISSSPLQTSRRPSVDDFPKGRRTSVTFDPIIRTGSGAGAPKEDSLTWSSKPRIRGRSLLDALAEDKERRQRPHSESDRSQYNPVTGELIPRQGGHSRETPRVGALRHPLLSTTVDEMASEAHREPVSMTTDATVSPSLGAVNTPPGSNDEFLLSPVSASVPKHALSYDDRVSNKYMDQSRRMANDFFSQAGSLKRSPNHGHRTSTPRFSTSSSARSPRSAASGFLASFGSRRRSGLTTESEENRPVSPDAEGQTVGDDYVLGKQIGFGGFSVVKEAFHMKEDGSQRKIAAKIVRRNIVGKSEAENDNAQTEFDHEVELWRFLRHPRILPLEAVYKTEDATFCFIPLNTGGTLFDLVRVNRSGLPDALARRYTYQLATAIRYLHEDVLVAHRDIKLENILLDTSVDPPNIRLCDFGMAEWITQDLDDALPAPDYDLPSPQLPHMDRAPRPMGPADSSTSAFAGGSLEYAAPEIVKVASREAESAVGRREAERGVVSPSSDIWALGVCAYSLIVGSRPFSDAFQPRVVMAILAGDWGRDRLMEKGGEEAFEVVEACLDMDPRNRADVNEVMGFDWLRDEAEREEEEMESGTRVFGNRGWGAN